MHLGVSKRLFIVAFGLILPVLGFARRQDQPSRQAAGDLKLEYGEKWGYLPSVLKHFKVPISSQTLVFAKSSFQLTQIAPEAPRAIYFNDDVYIGWVNHGQFIEVATMDPKTGPVFYTLAQEYDPHPALEPDVDRIPEPKCKKPAPSSDQEYDPHPALEPQKE